MDRKKTFQIDIKGLVQGVGFRPFTYRLAKKYSLTGWVENRNDGVSIKITGTIDSIGKFIDSIEESSPPASNIDSTEIFEVEKENFSDFQIAKSKSTSNQITNICPDIAVCNDCLSDMRTQQSRINYPFINCTNCGPRFTIIKALPYDRDKTTMSSFNMCSKCKDEYTDIMDRRFHAQPIACSDCGPAYSLLYNGKVIDDSRKIVDELVSLIKNKKIVAIKGIGGFFLSCDALNEDAVSKLRTLKNREGKPFAVMFSGLNTLREYAFINELEKTALLSWRRPIVILKQKRNLAPSVSVSFNTIGAMLPYMPLHHLLFENSDISAIVLTSGNISERPIVIENSKAVEELSSIADATLVYNRDIYNRTDDSVVTIINSKERIFRRSRGYVPTPISLPINVDGILATGAELVNCFGIGKDNQAILSQHIGDLKNIETYDFYCQSIERFKEMFRFNPSLIVSDMHPDYLSTRYAEESGLKHIKVQHHHAHIASCMAEHQLDEQVIGISFDGLGFGDDNNAWGSEFLVCDLKGYNRVNHFEYVPVPGGDKVSNEPWRMAVSYLHKVYDREFLELNLPFSKNIDLKSIELILNAIDQKVNCPLTSGAGRLFDAVAALINLCSTSKFHAEAPMRLESIINSNIFEEYDYSITPLISFDNAIRQIVNDILCNKEPSTISTKFHNTIISVIIEVVNEVRKQHRINKVVLSGGTFQNRYLLERVENRLVSNHFEVFTHSRVPTNDGGIALGQMIIAAKKLYSDAKD